jgi:hypothetical protein
MTYDEPRDQILLVGTGAGDPWAWSPSALGWTAPPRSSGYTGTTGDLWLTYDLTRGRAMFTLGEYAVLSEWDGAVRDWTTVWPTNPPTPGPAAAGELNGAATDPISGLTWFVTPTSVWAWSGGAQTWTEHPVGPTALPWDDRGTMVFDESRGTLVLLVPDWDVGGHLVLRVFERAVP